MYNVHIFNLGKQVWPWISFRICLGEMMASYKRFSIKRFSKGRIMKIGLKRLYLKNKYINL